MGFSTQVYLRSRSWAYRVAPASLIAVCRRERPVPPPLGGNSGRFFLFGLSLLTVISGVPPPAG
jgi:hypothetical protein